MSFIQGVIGVTTESPYAMHFEYAHKFARNGCIRHALNESASASGELCLQSTPLEFTPEPCFVLTIPDFGPLDAKTWPRDAPDHTYCI